jgi:peptide/nickel transport system permease protein
VGAYLLRRLAIAVPTLIGVSLVVFFMLRTAGGDPVEARLGLRGDPAQKAQLRHELGLDRPLPIQYLDFMSRALRGDLGRSYRSNALVVDEIGARLPATIELAVVAMAVAIVIGLTVGIALALRRDSLLDHLGTVASLLGVSIPNFWLGLILIIVFGLWLRWLPISGRIDPRLGADPSQPLLTLSALVHGDWVVAADALRHLVLPVIALATWPAAVVARLTRASLLEGLRQDYARTARAKGLMERGVVLRHALRNALLPVATVVGLEFGTLLGGAVLTETIFAWPGLGQLTVTAIGARDYQIVQGVVLVIGAMFVGLNLLVDVLYAWLDPRIRYG